MKWRYLLLCCLGLFSCAPTISEFQSARTIEKEKLEITPTYSNSTIARNNNLRVLQHHFGVGLGYGINDRFDVKLRYEFINTIEDKSLRSSVIGMEGKYSLLEDKISFATAIGKGIGRDLEGSLQLHPKMIFSLPVVKNQFELTFIPKYLLLLNGENNDLFATNIGLAYSKDLAKWAIRIDYGFLFEIYNADGNIHSLGLGFNYILN